MIYPIVAYGDPVLKKPAEDIPDDYPGLDELIESMFETMYNASGVGLAAPQIGKSLRLFVVDASPFAEDEEVENADELRDFKRAFINPEIIEEEGDEWDFNEGCLSIPDVREDVTRKPKIRVQYEDAEGNERNDEFDGILARIIQHEYDHIEGILFTDHLSPLKKRLLKGKLKNIAKGKVDVPYRMRFPLVKKR